jgi:hypothetical protein
MNDSPADVLMDASRRDTTRFDNTRPVGQPAGATSPRRLGLSKTKITAFEQCPKRLWLSVHRPDRGVRSEGVDVFLRTGHEVGDLACRALTDGIMVLAEPNLAAALAATRELLDAGADRPIFEATLEHDGVLVRIDILEPDGAAGWRMAEVKTAARVKDYHRADIATQLWVARNTGLPITSAGIRHIDTSFILHEEGNYDGLFRDTDVLTDVEALIAGRGTVVEAARSTLAGEEPDIDPGPHCDQPFSCEFAKYCHSSLPPPPEWPVTILPHGGGKKWLADGIDDLLALEPGKLGSDLHRRVHAATISGEPYHDAEAFCASLAQWPFPKTWLDFETIAFTIPRWIGTRPFEQVPFQFSAHLEQEDETVEHVEFLSLDGADPRAACARMLIERLLMTGAIITYNASFERSRILDLARFCPDLADQLQALASRIVDLLPLTRTNWYHRDQRGSWSIKAVLPTVAPELDYDDLTVKDGQAAQLAYLEAIAPETAAPRRDEIDAALRAYCRRDTEAMMVLANRLTGTA